MHSVVTAPSPCEQVTLLTFLGLTVDLAGGGNLKVPCLRIEERDLGYRWMYESSDIVHYLESRFVANSAGAAA